LFGDFCGRKLDRRQQQVYVLVIVVDADYQYDFEDDKSVSFFVNVCSILVVIRLQMYWTPVL